MQSTPSSSHSLLFEALSWLTTPAIATAIGGFIMWLLVGRRKVQPEVNVLAAQAVKDRAEARWRDGDTVNKAWDRIDEMQVIIDGLRASQLVAEREKQEMQRTIETQANTIKLQANQIDNFISVEKRLSE